MIVISLKYLISCDVKVKINLKTFSNITIFHILCLNMRTNITVLHFNYTFSNEKSLKHNFPWYHDSYIPCWQNFCYENIFSYQVCNNYFYYYVICYYKNKVNFRKSFTILHTFNQLGIFSLISQSEEVTFVNKIWRMRTIRLSAYIKRTSRYLNILIFFIWENQNLLATFRTSIQYV